MKRILAALALVVSGLATAPASAAPGEYEQYDREYWFGTIGLDHTVYDDVSHFLTLEFSHPDREHPLPFHSVVRGRLIDCRGRVAHRAYGSMVSAKVGKQPWRSDAELSLNLPRKGGPFARWEVSLRSKGRKTLRWTITDGGSAFRLGCNGGYRRHKGMFWAPQYAPKRPLNAAFKKKPARVIATRVKSFGRVRGAAKVGSRLRVTGARDGRGRASCGASMTITWPGKPAVEPTLEGTTCDAGVLARVPRTVYFRKTLRNGDRKFVRAPARGKDLAVSVNFHVRGHDYLRITPLGRIR